MRALRTRTPRFKLLEIRRRRGIRLKGLRRTDIELRLRDALRRIDHVTLDHSGK